jgi:hypothetical protein
VQYSELTHYHLIKEMSFPTSKSLQCKFLSQMRGLLCGQRRISRACARTKQKRKSADAHDARLWGVVPARLRQKVREKIPDRFLLNF